MLPTPTAHDGSSNGISAASRQGGPSLLDRLRLLPTPTASDAKNATHRTHTGGPSLPDEVRLLPTPRATDGSQGCPAQRGSQGDLMLPAAVLRLLTPQASDGISSPSPTRPTRNPHRRRRRSLTWTGTTTHRPCSDGSTCSGDQHRVRPSRVGTVVPCWPPPSSNGSKGFLRAG